MHHFWALGALALLVAAGAAYRIATVLFFLGFTYVFLLESALYLNHFYLICLVSFMIFVPAHRAFSVDAALRPGLHRGGSGLGDLAPTIPGGRALLLRRHREARLRLAAGEPIRSWMVGTTDFPLVGETFTEEWMVLGASWFGLLDLLVVPGLL